MSASAWQARTWQSAVALLTSALIILPISWEYAYITFMVGLPTAVSVSLAMHRRRRYLRPLVMTRRRVGVILLTVTILFSVIISIAFSELAGPIMTSVSISAFLPVTTLPRLTRAIYDSPEMRFRPRVLSELLAAIAVGCLITMVYLGVNLLGIVFLLGD